MPVFIVDLTILRVGILIEISVVKSRLKSAQVLTSATCLTGTSGALIGGLGGGL
jgi:hypothetical protein